MKRLRQIALPVVAGLMALGSMAAGVNAYTGGTLPGWGSNSDKDLMAGPLGVTQLGDPGEVPVAISIPDADVDAEVEKNKIDNGQMLDPSGPWVVSWYQETGKAGDTRNYRNMVMSGHVDYWDVGPAVFRNLGSLQEGSLISVTGETGEVYTYSVSEVYLVAASPSPEELAEIVEPKEDASVLTIITCGGTFDYDKGEYESRTIVRATLVGTTGGDTTEASSDDTAEPTEADTTTGELANGATATTTDDGINVRSEASTSGDIVTTLAAGDTVTITGDSQEADGYVWWPVQTSDGSTGWVVQDFLTPVQ